MMSKMDELLKKILNDRDIFYHYEEIFNIEEWNLLRNNFKDKKDEECKRVIKEKIDKYDQKIKSKSLMKQTKNYEEKDKLQKAKRQCEVLIKAISEKPNLLSNLFEYLDSFGLIESNLPSPSAMDDYGKVIERYGIGIVEQFFMDRINRENNKYTKNALKKLLEFVKELYHSNQSPLEIAYFVRKLNSLTTLWEVLNE